MASLYAIATRALTLEDLLDDIPGGLGLRLSAGTHLEGLIASRGALLGARQDAQ